MFAYVVTTNGSVERLTDVDTMVELTNETTSVVLKVVVIEVDVSVEVVLVTVDIVVAPETIVVVA